MALREGANAVSYDVSQERVSTQNTDSQGFWSVTSKEKSTSALTSVLKSICFSCVPAKVAETHIWSRLLAERVVFCDKSSKTPVFYLM